jgi:hypothetical protein
MADGNAYRVIQKEKTYILSRERGEVGAYGHLSIWTLLGLTAPPPTRRRLDCSRAVEPALLARCFQNNFTCVKLMWSSRVV